MAGEQGQKIAFLKDALNALATAVNKVSAGLIDLDKIISKVTGKTREFAKEQQNAAQTMNRVGKNLQQTSKDVDNYGKKTEKAGKSQKGFFGNMAKNLKTIVSFYGAYQVLNGVLSAASSFFIGGAKRAIELEKAFADLSAVAGVSKDDIELLKNEVFAVAGVTSFTATEIVALQKELAKLGTSTDDIVNLTGPIALLAQALGEEPGGVAATLKKTLNQFQATSEESNRFANVLLGAVNETALSMQDLGTALSYVGPLASQMGVSIEETVSLLGILADNGFKASKAGTGLRQFFITAAKDGRPFNEFLEDLAQRNLDVSDNIELFNKTGASQALVIENNTERLAELVNEMGDMDRLLRSNAEQMSSTQGQLDLLASAYDKARIRFSDYITQTEFFLELLERLDPESAGQARAFKFLANATDEGTESFNKLTTALVGFQTTEDEVTAGLEARWQILAEGSGLSAKQIKNLKNQYDELIKSGSKMSLSDFLSLQAGRYNLEEFQDASIFLKGIVDLAEESAIQTRKQEIAQAAQNDEYRAALGLTTELEAAARNGNMTEQEKARVTKILADEQTRLTEAYNKETDVDRSAVLEKRIALYEQLETNVKNLTNAVESEEERTKRLNKERKEREKALKAEIDLLKEQTDANVEAINERARIDSALAQAKGDLDEVAEVELNRMRDVSAAYQYQSTLISRLIDEYPDFNEVINEASSSALDMSKVLTSGLFKEAADTVNNYERSVKDLQKQLDDDKITQEDYNNQVSIMREELEGVFNTMRFLFGSSPELNQYFSALFDNFDETSKYLKKVKKDADKGKKSFEDWKEELKEGAWADIAGKAVDALGESLSEFNDTQLENTKNSIEAQLNAVKNRYEVEQDILKSQLDNQLITESQYRAKQLELRKAQIAEENSLERKIFEAQKKQDKQSAILEGAEAAAQAYIEAFKNYEPTTAVIVGSIGAGIAAAQATAQVSAISQRKFFPKKFAEGGVVNGPSHADGGVPFTVQGQSGYEMEGGEFIVNKRATAMHRDLLERINNSYRTNPQVGRMKFADGGLVPNAAGQSVDYLKAIAEATTSTAMNTNKPVRAYVADKDLRTNATERRLRDRNDRI